jgi:hypothetical protein
LKEREGETLSQYKYGLYVKDIAKIKKEIMGGATDKEVVEKWKLSSGQLGFIHEVL